jgi:hypothetical protein
VLPLRALRLLFKTDDQVWPDWLKLIEAYSKRFLVGTDASNHSRTSDQSKIDSVHAMLDQLGTTARKAVAENNLLRLSGTLEGDAR